MIRTLAVSLALLTSVAAATADSRVSTFPVTPGSGAHDVAPAPDGSVYYSGQAKGVLGRLDPKTGKVENIPIGSGSAPHGVVVGPDGSPWLTDGGLNANVRYAVKTKKVDTFILPTQLPNAHLNTALF